MGRGDKNIGIDGTSIITPAPPIIVLFVSQVLYFWKNNLCVYIKNMFKGCKKLNI